MSTTTCRVSRLFLTPSFLLSFVFIPIFIYLFNKPQLLIPRISSGPKPILETNPQPSCGMPQRKLFPPSGISRSAIQIGKVPYRGYSPAGPPVVHFPAKLIPSLLPWERASMTMTIMSPGKLVCQMAAPVERVAAIWTMKWASPLSSMKVTRTRMETALLRQTDPMWTMTRL